MPETSSPLLEVEHLSKWFPQKRKINDVIQHRERRWLKAVNDVSSRSIGVKTWAW